MGTASCPLPISTAAGRDRERALCSLQRHRQSCQPALLACLLPPPGLFCLLFPLPPLPTDRESSGFQAEHPQEEPQDGREAGFSSQLVAVWQPPAEGPWVQDVPQAHPDLQQSTSRAILKQGRDHSSTSNYLHASASLFFPLVPIVFPTCSECSKRSSLARVTCEW